MKKIALITGANGNLGESVVNKFLEEGYDVIGIVYKRSLPNTQMSKHYEEIELNFMGSLNPCIINGVDDDKYIYLVLPVRLAQDDY